MQFLELDIRDTFEFLPIPNLDALNLQRALYTAEILRLNDRDVLIQARRTAFGSYFARLKEYVGRKADGDDPETLQNYVTSLQRMDHPTVWKEMQRQEGRFPKLAELFDAAPEALDW